MTYVAFPTAEYDKNYEQQHVNCSNTTIKSSTFLQCGEGSILADDNKGNISTLDGLQTSELEKFFIWKASSLDPLPFVTVVFENRIIPHSIDLYFHVSAQNSINIPKIMLYWSNTNPIESQNTLPFQRIAYFIASGMYKYKAILMTNNVTPFTYMQIKMEPTNNKNYNWIFLSEIKVHVSKAKGTIINSYDVVSTI